LIADTNNIYYYNDKWQVLCDYNDSGTLQRWFAYGKATIRDTQYEILFTLHAILDTK